jgi:ketosteroid isomerase-like protein
VSAQNVQIIRQMVEAFNERDFEGMAQNMEPDAELYPLRAQLEGKIYRGHDGLREMLADFDQDWEFVRMDAEEYREAGDHVVVLGRLGARGRTSGVDLDVPMAFVWRLREGKVVHARSFSEQAEALRDAGLG